MRSLATFHYIKRIPYPMAWIFFSENLPRTVRYFKVVRHLICYIARVKKISLSEMSLFHLCMMFLLYCATTCVNISTCVVSF